MNGSEITVRKAVPEDVEVIHELLEVYAQKGVVLRRSCEDIRFYLGNFFVAEKAGRFVGCAAARSFGGGLFEVRSLVVAPAEQGAGAGRALVAGITADLDRRLPEWRLFTLTGSPGFFLRLGFRQVEKDRFPEKIWSDCVLCPKNRCCDEVALLLDGGRSVAEKKNSGFSGKSAPEGLQK